jgi:hypothetical protein
MSIAAVEREAESLLLSASLSAQAHADVRAVLRANRSDMLAFLLALGLDAKVSPASAVRRVAGIFFNIAALQVADDIADGDCDYLDHPEGTGTAAQYILQNLFYKALLTDVLQLDTLVRVADAMVAGAAPQSFEVRGFDAWTLTHAKATAEGFGGAHHGAYFQIMWHGTSFESCAFSTGWAFGVGVSVTSDIRSNDLRFRSLNIDDRVRLIDWALDALAPVREIELPSVRRGLDSMEAQLVAELGRVHDEMLPTLR